MFPFRHMALALAVAMTAFALVLLPAIPVPTLALARQAPPAGPNHTVSFPADTAAHLDMGTEWWYFVGHLADAAGHTYGFEVTFFRFAGLRRYFPGSPVDTAYRTDVAITDEAAHRFHEGVGYAAASAQATASATQVQLRAATVSVSTVGPLSYHIHGGTSDGSLVDLTVASRRAPMLVHGGYTGWGSGYTYYYSLTRMQATGTLTVGSRRIAVRGIAWNDHQWGNMQQSNVIGWQWMALQLSDGADVSLVNERPYTSIDNDWAQGLLPDGRQVYTPRAVITVLDHWRSPATHTVYPSLWRVQVPALWLDVTVRPTIHDQEVIDRFAVNGWLFSYWEGSCTIMGMRAGHRISGKAYVELTGYGAPPTIPQL